MADGNNKRRENQQQQAKDYYDRGCFHANAARYEEAIDNFDRILSIEGIDNEKISVTFYKRGYSYLKLQQYNEALDDYRMYLKFCGQHWRHKGLVQIGIIFFELNLIEQAIEYFSNAIKETGVSEEEMRLYYFYRGQAYDSDGQTDRAQSDYRCVIQSQNDFLRACAYDKLGDPVKAVQAFSDSLERVKEEAKFIPISAELIHFRRGLIHQSMNEHEKALKDFQEAVKLTKSSGSTIGIEDRVHFYSALSNEKLGNITEALANFKLSLSINAKQADVFYGRGELQYKLGRYDAAVRDHHHAFEIEREKFLPKEKSPQNDRLRYAFYAKKLLELENLLEKKEIGIEAELKELKAEYLQQQACFSSKPLVEIKLAAEMLDKGSIGWIINKCFHARIFIEKLAEKQNDSDTMIKNYIDPIQESLDEMFELLKERASSNNYDELEKLLTREEGKVHIQILTAFDDCRNALINAFRFILKKLVKLSGKPEEKSFSSDFGKYLFLRLNRIFFAVGLASTGIIGHSLTSNWFNMASYGLTALSSVIEKIPLEGIPMAKIFDSCKSLLSRIDQQRIGNTLQKIADLGSHEILSEMSAEISEELTDMYQEQMASIQTEEEAETVVNNACLRCISNCWESIGSCLRSCKNQILNETNDQPVMLIVTCATNLIVRRLTEIQVSEFNNVNDLKEILIDAVCRPDWFSRAVDCMFRNTIKMEYSSKEKKSWTVTNFFYRPAINVGKKPWSRKAGDEKTYGYRKLSKKEQKVQDNPDKLKRLGFSTFEEQKNFCLCKRLRQVSDCNQP